MWIYTSENEWESISLYGSCVVQISTDHDLTFYFNNNGFWVSECNSQNPYRQILRTDKSQLVLQNGFCIETKVSKDYWVFGKKLKPKVLPLKWEDICARINSGEWQFEISTELHKNKTVLFEGYLGTKQKPYLLKCHLIFSFDCEIYSWNNMYEDYPL
ncbi:MAG: hypothetical protein WBI17_06875 [Clostridiaceae bacterium]